MKPTIVLLSTLLLSACSSISIDPKIIENRAVCTVARDEMHVISKWWRFGISSQIAEADAKEACRKPGETFPPAVK